MARIPIYQRQVVQDALPGATRYSGDSADGRALQGIAQTGMHLADQMMREHQHEQDNIAKTQTANLLSEGHMYWQEESTKRAQAWKVGDPDMRDGLGKDFDKWVAENASKLSTPSAQEYFRQHAVQLKTGMQTNAFDFQKKATTTKLDADTAAGENLDERVVFDNPSQFDAVYTRRTEAELARSDLTEAQKIERATKRRARLATTVQKAEIEKDPAAWLRANYGSAPGDVDPAASPVASGSVEDVKTGGSVPDSLWRALLGQESGGRQMGKDGRPVTSQKGAVGIAQIMPATGPEAAKLAGLKWDERRFHQDAGYNEALGRAYFEKQLKDNGGDVRKAMAAYNGGPGRLKDAIAKAGPDGDWLANMPKETRDYVASISKNAGLDSAGKAGVKLASAGVSTASDAGSGMPAPSAQKSRTLGMVDPDMELQLKHYAETRVKQSTAQFRGDADRMLTDLTAAHKDGKVEQVPLDFAFFQKAYGPDAQRLHDEYQRSRSMGHDIASFGTMSETEIASTIARTAPAVGAGYAAEDARQNTRIQAATHVLQKRAADPVSYAVSTSPDARRYAEQLRATGLTPEARQNLTGRYMDAQLAEQRRLGIRETRLLSPREADAIGAQAMNARKPEDSANLISALESQYGERYFPQVFNELVKSQKISGELMIIPNLPTQSARESVSRLSRVKETDLAVGVPADSQKVIKDGVSEMLVDFVKAVPIPSQQSVGLVNSYESSLRKLAYEQVAAGVSPSDAVKRANDMLLGHYEFRDGVRYPKTAQVGLLKSGMSDVISNLINVDAPMDAVGNRSQQEAQTAYLDLVKSRPLWHTTDDDRGVQLWVLRENGTKVPVTRAGRPVTYTWQELAANPGKLDRRSVSGKIQ